MTIKRVEIFMPNSMISWDVGQSLGTTQVVAKIETFISEGQIITQIFDTTGEKWYEYMGLPVEKYYYIT